MFGSNLEFQPGRARQFHFCMETKQMIRLKGFSHSPKIDNISHAEIDFIPTATP